MINVKFANNSEVMVKVVDERMTIGEFLEENDVEIVPELHVKVGPYTVPLDDVDERTFESYGFEADSTVRLFCTIKLDNARQ